MYEDLADWAIKHAQKLGATYAEARLEETRGQNFILKNGILEGSGFSATAGLGIRIVIKNTMGFVSTNLLNKKNLEENLGRAVKLAKSASKMTEHTTMSEEKSSRAKYKVNEKVKLADISPEKKIGVLNEIEKALIATKVKLPGRYLNIGDWKTLKYLVNTDGSKIISNIPYVNFFYYLTAMEKGQTAQRMWQYGSTGGWELVSQWKLPSLLASEVKALKNVLQKGIAPPKGQIDLVASPQVTGIISHESCGHPYEADRIMGREAAQAGESFITHGMLGQAIAKPVVTLVDDPSVPGTYGFYKYDDEGVKARRKFLVKNGIITEFLQNRETASFFGTKSNGASRASEFDKEPIIRMSNTFFLEGDYSEEELVKDVKHGIFMKSFMEWNIDDKRYNNRYVGSECYLIENGEIKLPVRNPIIELTTPALYGAIDALADNTEFHAASCGKGEPMQAIPVTHGGPSIRLRGIRLG
ncbi:MAG: TldD/PmbA family protein [DPANN group archaeon]|nr:TldD/PmbA family protein [DPANN group archaeon]